MSIADYEQYEETQEVSSWIRAAILIGFVAMGISCFFMFKDPSVPRFMGWAFAVLTGAMFWAYWVFARLVIRIGGGILEFGYGPFHPKVPRENIEWIAKETITLLKYGGIGIRIGAGAVCYNSRFGEGVRIHVHGRKRDWVFSANNPEEIARVLGKEILPGQGTPPTPSAASI